MTRHLTRVLKFDQSLYKICHCLSHFSVHLSFIKTSLAWGRGDGQLVSILAIYSNDPSSYSAYIYSFSVKFVLENSKNKQKEAGDGHIYLRASIRLSTACATFPYIFLSQRHLLLSGRQQATQSVSHTDPLQRRVS